MEKVLHRASERGGGDHGWLKTKHSFSFADWYEPTRMGFGKLRVINDDWIAPHEGFGAHQHRDMEIITIVTSGVLTHEDSLGNHGVIPKGDVQIMSAGSGVTHSEKNDGDEPLTLFQIWIEAKVKAIMPRYDQKNMHLATQGEGLQLLVGPLDAPDVLTINQDACISYGVLEVGHALTYDLKNSPNGVYVFVIDGALGIAGEELHSRDAIGMYEVPSVSISASEPSSFLVFEVPS